MIDLLTKLSNNIQKESELKKYVRVDTLGNVNYENQSWPFYKFTLGSENPNSAVFFIVGGVHGLERIGAQLAWSFLKTTIDRIMWDRSLRNILEEIRIVVLPLVNPYGYEKFTRSNGNGVDLMRNSPIEALDKAPYLLGGQRKSSKIPWFQGTKNKLEIENQYILKTFTTEVQQSNTVVSLDFHSGFGLKDRLWFPYSYKKEPFQNLAELHALTQCFEQSYPYHIYLIEPQSNGYLLNGDMWDYLYIEYLKNNPNGVFIPLTLEMGSWNWVKKNPLQIFSKHGAFNPIKEHRIKRTYRRHHLMLDFMMRALYSKNIWSSLDSEIKQKHEYFGNERWYKSK